MGLGGSSGKSVGSGGEDRPCHRVHHPAAAAVVLLLVHGRGSRHRNDLLLGPHAADAKQHEDEGVDDERLESREDDQVQGDDVLRRYEKG